MKNSAPRSSAPRTSRSGLRRLRDALQAEDAPRPFTAPVIGPAPAREPDPDAATILTVCTGNICRSPMSEVLLRASLIDRNVHVHSAGTHALIDHAMTDQAQHLAIDFGAREAHAKAHRARYLTERLITQADLVLAMSREHRSFVVQLHPSALKRTFTMREFARLAAGMTDAEVSHAAAAGGTVAGQRLQALARAVGERRGLIVGAPEDDDVIDPYLRSQDTYDLAASQLAPTVQVVQRVVRLALATDPVPAE